MWNIMLDAKPTAWNGYPVNTDFRVGLQISLVMEDNELSSSEKVETICDLLFPGIYPETEEIQEVLEWFLNGWNYDKRGKSREGAKKAYDFDIDQGRIYTAFKRQYGIDLNTADLHYWEFMMLLTNLEECSFTRVIDLRQKKITGKMSTAEKKALGEAKKIYGLEAVTQDTETKAKEQEAIEIFLAKTRGGA